jgi:exopolysaccharide production protein ExoZ
MRYLTPIDSLRGVAALMVVAGHAVSRASDLFPDQARTPWSLELQPLWYFGVDLFFVISGLVMAHTQFDNFGLAGAARTFFTRRVIRIVPLYWAATSLAVALLVVAPGLFAHRERVSASWVLGSYLFLPVASPEGLQIPVIGVGWTLNYEMLFYVLFAIGLALPRGKGIAFILAALAVSAFRAPLVIEFFGGMAVAVLLRVAPGPLQSCRWALLALALAVLAFSPNLAGSEDFSRALWWGFPAFCIVAFVATSSRPMTRIELLLGAASYSIYLTQVFSIPAVSVAIRMSGITSFQLSVLIAIAVTAVSGILVWWVFERPAIRTLNRLLLGRRPALEPAG